MSKSVFIVNAQDFSYQPPMIKIKYAGESIKEACEQYHKNIISSNYRVTLDVVEDTFSLRILTKEVE